VRISLASAGIWWALFTLIPFSRLRNRGAVSEHPFSLALGFKQLAATVRDARRYPQTLLFLAAYLLYNDGIQAVISLASVYGAEELGMGESTLISTILLVQFVAFGGALAFGTEPLTSPIGGTLGAGESTTRLLVIAGYIAVTLLIPAGIAFLMTVLTDVPLGAVGAAVVIVIVVNILDAIEALGSLRRLLPGEYADAWVDALGTEVSWDRMAIGIAYSVTVFAILAAVAVLRFDRKDITS
jgi:UMF1 family MFS transporter